MIRGEELEKRAYKPEHFLEVLAEISRNFPRYFKSFVASNSQQLFADEITVHKREQEKYRDYLDPEALEEFEDDPNAFKRQTRTKCPIIHRCLQSQDEAMKDYKQSFNTVSGRQLLNPICKLAQFGRSYVLNFDDERHECAANPGDLGLDALNEAEYGCGGVIGYGIQSSMLYGMYPRQFAHRSQVAVWSLYFLSGRKDFGLKDGSEFLMANPSEGTVEQNYFYPAELFGFYALQVYLLLKTSLTAHGVTLKHYHRYIYLSVFCDHIGEIHRSDIQIFKRSSQHVESQPWF